MLSSLIINVSTYQLDLGSLAHSFQRVIIYKIPSTFISNCKFDRDW
jgi:hypothetical protein